MRFRIHKSAEQEPLEHWPSIGCSLDKYKFRILLLDWSQTFEKSLFQGYLQLISSVDPFPSRSHGPNSIIFFVFFLLVTISFFLFHSHIPLHILLYFWLWNLCGRRVSSHKMSWNYFLFLIFDPDNNLAYCLFANFGCTKQHAGS